MPKLLPSMGPRVLNGRNLPASPARSPGLGGRLQRAVKAFWYTGNEPVFFDAPLPRTVYDYARDVRGGLDSNVVMAPVQWVMRTFTEARLVVQRRTAGIWEYAEDHPLELLVERPNDFYDGDTLWKATLISYLLDGNAYWLPTFNEFGTPVGLWYVPHWMIRPRWPQDGTQFISHYEYYVDGHIVPLRPDQVVHFRFGLDPRNIRSGFSPLRALLREVFTDDEAANFSAALLRNYGVPGIIIAPKNEHVGMTESDKLDLKEYVRTGFSGDKRGDPMVLSAATDVHQFGFDPNQLSLTNIRDIAEERVCAALGLPAAVVGFGSGLQSTKVGATMRELRRLAWVQCLIPIQKSLANQLTQQFLVQWVSQVRRFRVRFDLADVSAFQEEQNQQAERISGLVDKGILRVDRAQEALGLEVDPKRKVYLGAGATGAAPVPGTGAGPTKPGTEGAGAVEDEDEDEEDEAKLLRALQARHHGNGGS